MGDSPRIRSAAVAGSFYPSDPQTLARELNAMLADVEPAPVKERPLILIAPHAGYRYSGRVAAHGYKLLESRSLDTIVVVSPSHMEYFAYASIFDGDAYETPLGRIPVDTGLARELSTHARVELSGSGHVQNELASREHALEVQLPFLQAVLGDFRIVPIVMGDQSWDTCRELGDALGPLLQRENTLVVISSDLSHFYPYDVAVEMDGAFIDLLRQMDPSELYRSVKQKTCEACGAGPVVAGLIAAQHVSGARCDVLAAANSGDVTGDHSRVVGYACAAIFEHSESATRSAKDPEADEMPITSAERAHLLAHARSAIAAVLRARANEPAACVSPLWNETRAVFVTLRSRSRLRGCVGTMEPRKPLRETIRDMAVAAAFSDPRFDELTPEELDDLRIEISVLSALRQIAGPGDITVGRDGLLVRRGRNSGVLLPQVAAEQRWDAVRFLERTCEKAALPADAWQGKDARLYAFSATVFGEQHEIRQ